MKFPILSIILVLILSFQSCSKDEPAAPEVKQDTPTVKPEEEEESSTPEPYFTLNVASDYYLNVTKEAYVVIHDADGNLLDFKLFKNGDQLVFEKEPDVVVTEKLTITQFTHTKFSAEDDYYTVITYPLISKGSIWNFNRLPGTYNPMGKFDVALNNVPDWNYYNLSNSTGAGTSGSRFYKYFNNPEDAEPFITIDQTNWFAENDFLLSVIDGNKDLKYVELIDVQQNDSIVLSDTDLLDYDSYLTIELPNYEEFFVGVSAYETNQDFDRTARILSESRDYSFSEPVTEVELGYLSRYSRFRTSAYLKDDKYVYNMKRYGAKPSAVSFPEKGNLTITDSTRTSFNFQADFTFQRESTKWTSRRDFFDPEFSSTTWFVFAPNSNDVTIYELPEEIVSQYSNLDIDQLKHRSTELFLQSDSYEEFLMRRRNETKIGNSYVEESMLFGETD